MRVEKINIYRLRKLMANVFVLLVICLLVIIGSKEMVSAANTFTILEIVPHDNGSVFSYYSEDTITDSPLGDEGIRRVINNYGFNEVSLHQPDKIITELRPITVIEDQIKRTELNDLVVGDVTYETLVKNEIDFNGIKWNIKTTDDIYEEPVGYFEYVGEEGWGLYNITDDVWKIKYQGLLDIENGTYDLQNLTGFTSDEDATGESNGGETITGKDFHISFSKNINQNFEKENPHYSFEQNITPLQKQYLVKGKPTLNKDSGEYYKEDGYYIFDSNQTKLREDDTLQYYDVFFERYLGWGNEKEKRYYIDKITPVEEGKGNYYARVDQWNSDLYLKPVSKGEKGIYSNVIREIPQNVIKTSDSNGASQNWIWITSDEARTNASSKDDLLHPKKGTRIYVNNGGTESGVIGGAVTGDFKKSIYTQHGYASNEWFKVFCLNWDKYKDDITTQTAQELVKQARDSGDIDNINIKCMVKQPEEVTAADIEVADMVYLGGKYGVEGLQSPVIWNSLTGRNDTSIQLTQGFQVGQDLDNFGMVLELYREFYFNRKAIMIGADVRLQVPKNSNIYKIFGMLNFFHDPKAFGFFIPSVARPTTEMILKANAGLKGNYCKINNDGSVDLSGSPRYNPIIENNVEYVLPADAPWSVEYFKMYPGIAANSIEDTPFLIAGTSRQFAIKDDNHTDDNKHIGDSLLNITWDPAGIFKDYKITEQIFLMMQTLNEPNITFPNTQKDGNDKPVIYIDDFQDAFSVDFKVEGFQANINKITISGKANSSGSFVQIKEIPLSPSVRLYEQNSLLGTNRDLNYQRQALGYLAAGSNLKLFPPILKVGMEAVIKIDVSYLSEGSNMTKSEEVVLRVRDSFDLN